MKKLSFSDVIKTAVRYIVIIVGCAIYGAATDYILLPNSVTSGGVMGIAIIINKLTQLPIGVMNILMNVPLFLAAWKLFGKKFLIDSLIGMSVSSVAVDLFALRELVLTGDPMLASIIGGVVKGAGLGMVLYTGATTGGVDIVAKFLRKKFAHINFGTIVLIMDTAVILTYAAVLGKYESAMYSLVSMFVIGKVTDAILYGTDNSCICYIISQSSDMLVKAITFGKIHRGVTVLEGVGGYSGKEKQVIMCVIKRPQIAELKKTVKSIDPGAFVILSDAKNVFGMGFDSISEVR